MSGDEASTGTSRLDDQCYYDIAPSISTADKIKAELDGSFQIENCGNKPCYSGALPGILGGQTGCSSGTGFQITSLH